MKNGVKNGCCIFPVETKTMNACLQWIVSILFVCLLRIEGAFAQFFSFSKYDNIVVEKDGGPMQNPWTGSYNSGQFWPCDMNNDGENDMLILDKNTDRVQVYIAVNEGGNMVWKYNSDYEDLLPQSSAWIATADFNCDGRLDLFTSTALGIKIYKNVIIAPNQAGFVLEVDGLQSIGLSGGLINVQVNIYGAPAIVDVDNDGDLDVLTFDFSSGNIVETHRNRMIQNTGSCAGFDLKKEDCVFGLFSTTPTCGLIKVNTNCGGQRPPPNDIPVESSARVAHTGAQLAVFDLDGDGDKDLLVGDLGCPFLNRLTNGGTLDNALITSADTLFPSANQYVKLPVFPSAYFMDVNFDGKKDMVVTPTSFSYLDDADLVNTKSATQLYLDQSSSLIPDFQLLEKDFIQNQTIDLGVEATPVFADIDADGDQDLLIGHRGIKTGNLIVSSIYLYRNTGTVLHPAFVLETTDYKGLGSLLRRLIKPIFTDINGDGATDFCWISSPGGTSGSTNLSFLLNQNSAGQPFLFPDLSQAATLTFNFTGYDCPVFVDINGDSKMDMLIGKISGRVEYWQQISSWPNLQYQLENNNYGNVSRAPYSSNSNLAIADADLDGKSDLVVGDETGAIKIYRNFLLNTTNTFPADSTTYFNILMQQRMQRNWGTFVSPALADLNGDGYPELAIGTKGGGVFLSVNRLGPNAVDGKVRQPVWNFWPNPNTSSFFLNWSGPMPSSISIFNVQGKEIHTWAGIDIELRSPLYLPELAQGLYFLKFSDNNQSVSFRLIIH